jgi:hypothetical protein
VKILARYRSQLDFRDLWLIALESETDSAGAQVLRLLAIGKSPAVVCGDDTRGRFERLSAAAQFGPSFG